MIVLTNARDNATYIVDENEVVYARRLKNPSTTIQAVDEEKYLTTLIVFKNGQTINVDQTLKQLVELDGIEGSEDIPE